MLLDAKIPAGPLSEKWDNYKDSARLVNPANKRNKPIVHLSTTRLIHKIRPEGKGL